MSEQRDPLDMLAAAKPHDEPLDPGENARAEDLLQHILSTPQQVPNHPRRRRRSRTAIALGLAAVTVSVGTVAAIVITREQPTTLTSLSCWSEARLPQPHEAIVISWAGDDPAQACEPVWTESRFESISSSEVPPLIACVNEGGDVVVMPGDQTTCSELGLSNFDSSIDSDIDRSRAAIERIQTTVTESACLSPADAIDAVASILADSGLDAWTVVPPDPQPDTDACMTAGVDVQAEQVFIVPGVSDSD